MALKQYFIILGVLFVMLLLTSQAATRELRPFSSKHFMPSKSFYLFIYYVQDSTHDKVFNRLLMDSRKISSNN